VTLGVFAAGPPACEDLVDELLLQRFDREEVVAADEEIIKKIVL
jgi:hypothetical protein